MLRRFLLLMGLLLVSGFAWGSGYNIAFFFKFCAYAPPGYPDATYTIKPESADNNNGKNYAGGWETGAPSDPQVITITTNDVNDNNGKCCLNSLTGNARSISTANPDGSHYQCSDGYFFQQDDAAWPSITRSQPKFNITYSSCGLDPIQTSDIASCSTKLVLNIFDTAKGSGDNGGTYVVADIDSQDPLSSSGTKRNIIVPNAQKHVCTIKQFTNASILTLSSQSGDTGSVPCPSPTTSQSGGISFDKPDSVHKLRTVCIMLSPATSGS